jgi:hypothetical protein
MSTTIDSNVVEMRFENSQFEQGVSQSMSSIEKLKNSLNFDSASSTAAQSLNVVVQGFDMLNYALANIVSSLANNAWTKIASVIKGLTVDNIAEGWSKYSTLMDGVQVIMSATRDQWDDQTAQMEYMTQQMEKLNWYTDETSWNMVDMTGNIGKFISAGVDIDTATTAMMGIGSWAGQSGAKVDQMSRAMYNLSQAMGMGTVRVQDWMSIENANMATKEFKETVIATALDMGKLKYNTDGDIVAFDRFGKEVEVTAETFRSTLAAGWFTGDVLTSTLKKYGDFAEGLHKTVDETGLTAAELLGHIEDYKKAMESGEDMTTWVHELANEEHVSNVTALAEGLEYLSNDYNELGYAAFKASQETRTFKDLQLAMKDAVSSAWMGIFQVVVGNYLESKELWSAWAEELYEVFVDPLNNVKRILDKAFNYFDSGNYLLQAMWNAWYNIKGVLISVQDAFASIFPENVASKILYFSMDLLKITEKFKLLDLPYYSDFENIKDGLSALLNVVKNFWKNIQTIAGAIGDAWDRIFPKSKNDTVTITQMFKSLAEWLEKVSEKFVLSYESAEKLERTFAGVFAVIDILKELLFALIEPFADVEEGESGLITNTLSVTATIGDWLVMLRDWIKENDIFKKAVTGIVDFIKSIPGKLDQVCQDLFGLGLDEVWNKIKEAATSAWNTIVNFFKNLPTYAEEASQALFGMSLAEVWYKIKEAAQSAWDKLKEVFQWIKDKFSKKNSEGSEEFGEGFSEGLEQSGESVKSFTEKLSEAFDKLKEVWEKVKPYLDEIAAGFKETFDSESFNAEGMGKGLVGGGIFVVLLAVAKVILTCVDAFEKLTKNKDKIVNSISGMFDSIGNAFTKVSNTLSKRISADTIKTIATAILELAAAIFVLSIIDQEKMVVSTVVIAALMAELAAIMDRFDKLSMDKKQFNQIKVVLGEMMIVIAEITAAIVIISKQNLTGCIAAAIIIGALMLEVELIVERMAGLDKFDTKQMVRVAAVAAMIGKVMIEIAAAISIIADMPILGITASAIALAALLVIMTLCMETLANAEGNIVKGAAASMLMGLAMTELAVALAILGKMDPISLLAGAVALSSVVAVLTLALMALASAEGNIIKGAAAMTIASAALVLIAGALAIVSSVVESGNILASLAALAAALAIVLVAAIPAQELSVGLVALGGAIALIGAGALMAGAGLLLFAEAVERLVAAGPGAVDILVDGLASFFTLIPSLVYKVGESILNLIDLFINSRNKILQGINTLMDILYQAAMTGIPKLLTVVETFLVGVLDVLINITPKIFEFLTTFFNQLWPFLIEQSPQLCETLVKLTMDALDALVAITFKITESAIAILLDVLEKLAENIAPITARLVEILIGTITGTFDGLTAALPKLMESVWNFVITMINSFADGLDDHAKELKAAIDHLCVSVWEAIKTFFGIHSPSTKFSDLAHDMIQGMINGLGEMIENAKKAITELADKVLTKICDFFGVDKPTNMSELGKMGHDIIQNMIDGISNMIGKAKEKITELADKVLTAICDFFGIKKPESANEFLNLGKTIIQKFNAGIYGMIEKAKNMITDFAKRVLSAVCSFFGVETPGSVGELYDIAKDLINGFIQGIYDKISSAVSAVGEFCDDVITKCKNAFGVASPSKVFAEIGRFLDEGLAIGIEKNTGVVDGASENLGQVALDSLSSAISSVTDIIDGMLDTDPVIRPVLDVSDIANGVSTIDGMLSSNRTLSLAAKSSMDINTGIAAKHESVSALDSLRASLSGLSTPGKSVTQNNTFNISGSNPKEIADEINKILNEQMVREDSVWA